MSSTVKATEPNALQLPPLYVIADVATLARKGMALREFVQQVLAAGVEILQLRDKDGTPQQVLAHAAQISELLAGSACLPVMNDRADLALLAGWHAVHVGHQDMPPEAVRRLLDLLEEEMLPSRRSVVGVSTHNDEQVRAANEGGADYVAVGPVFATGTKVDAEPVIGLEGVRRARELTRKPLVAIGGITPENARAVREAGADSVAVIGGLFRTGQSVEATAARLLHTLR